MTRLNGSLEWEPSGFELVSAAGDLGVDDDFWLGMAFNAVALPLKRGWMCRPEERSDSLDCCRKQLKMRLTFY